MKRMCALFLALMLLAGGALVWSASAARAGRSAVTLREVSSWGDPAAAAGLEAMVRTQLDDQLYWKTTLPLGGEAATRVSYDEALWQTPERAPDGVTLYGGIGGVTYYNNTGERDFPNNLVNLEAPFRQLMEQVSPGDSGELTVDFGTYFDYYPISLMVDLPGFSMDSYFELELEDRPLSEPELRWQKVYEAFCSFFRIPVPQGTKLDLTLERDEAGNVVSWGAQETGEGNGLDIKSVSAVTSTGCYFTFDLTTRWGEQADTSLIPGGYGIYCLPYTLDEGGVAQVEEDHLTMVYPLDPDVEILSLQTDEGEEHLLLLTREEDQLVLTVIRLADMTQVQRLAVADWPEESWGLIQFQGDGILVLGVWEGDLVVLLPRGDGGYTEDFRTRVSSDAITYYASWNSDMAYDGERLAWIGPADRPDGFQSCGFTLTVYDAAGLAYLGTYESSLDTPRPQQGSWTPCLLADSSSLTVRWTGET